MQFISIHGTFFIRLFLVLIMLAVTFPSSGRGLSLDEVILIAQEHDARLRAETYRAEARDAEGWRDMAVYGPVLRGTGSYMKRRDHLSPDEGSEAGDSVTNYYDREVTFELVQPLIDLEKASVAMTGIAGMRIAELEKKQAEDDLLLRVHQRYFSLLSAYQNLRLVKAEAAALKNQLNTVEEKLELGFGTVTDKHSAEARYRLSLADILQRKTERTNAIKALEEIIGKDLDEKIEDLQEEAMLPGLPLSAAEWLEAAQRSNTELNLTKTEAQVAKLALRRSESRFLPSLVFFADYKENRPDNTLAGYGEERSEMQIGLRVEANLLAGGQDIAATVAAFKRYRGAEEQVNVSERAMIRSVSSLWETIVDTRALIDAYSKASEANRLAMESTRLAYDEGEKALLDVLDAQQDYFRAQRAYKTSRYDYMVLLERFRQAVGVEDVAKYQTKGDTRVNNGDWGEPGDAGDRGELEEG